MHKQVNLDTGVGDGNLRQQHGDGYRGGGGEWLKKMDRNIDILPLGTSHLMHAGQ